MSRERIGARPPPDDADALGDFPQRTVARNRNLYRVCRKGRGPWWFGSSLEGRFDLPHPHGICYLAFDDIGALREAIGPGIGAGVVSAEWAQARVVRRLKPPFTVRAADITAPAAATFGVTLELHTVVPYDLPQAWARRLHEAGHDGVYHWLRHFPEGRAGLGLFGRSGERRHWPRGRAVPIAGSIASRLEEATGIRVAARPAIRQLRVIE